MRVERQGINYTTDRCCPNRHYKQSWYAPLTPLTPLTPLLVCRTPPFIPPVRYATLKNPRKLVWKSNLGVVDLELVFGEVTRTYSVTPLHATIIMYFEDQPRWLSKDLAAKHDTTEVRVTLRVILRGTASPHPYTKRYTLTPFSATRRLCGRRSRCGATTV